MVLSLDSIFISITSDPDLAQLRRQLQMEGPRDQLPYAETTKTILEEYGSRLMYVLEESK